MSRLAFIFSLILFMAIRLILSFLVVVIRPLVPFIKSRLDFERKNLIEESSLPYKKNEADLCFEISSEGELEQVRTLVEESLNRGKKIEILYSSPSVEAKCGILYKDFPEQVRLLRLPLLSGGPVSFLYFQSIWGWVKSPVVIFCRYDFFPELLLLKFFGKKFILISGATKKTSWYKTQSFKFFDLIVAATEQEKKNFLSLLGEKTKVYSCDFRIPRIAKRFERAQEVLAERLEIQTLVKKLEMIPAGKKIILGSAWSTDLKILNHPTLIERVKKGDLFLLLAPHKLDQDHVEELRLGCSHLFGPDLVEVVDKNTPYKNSPVVILQMGGLLCELYSIFSIAYVGGGYERSIHSVLEPLFSYNVVITGPVIHRSTEFDLAHELVPSEIHVLIDPESFYNIVTGIDLRRVDLKSRSDFLLSTDQAMKLIFKDILGEVCNKVDNKAEN